MKDVNFITYNPGCGVGGPACMSYIIPNTYLYDRTKAILYNKGKFLPNINPEWDKVVSSCNLGVKLQEESIQYDISMQKQILEDNSYQKNMQPWNIFIPKLGDEYTIDRIKNNTLKLISDSVMDFYRFQL